MTKIRKFTFTFLGWIFIISCGSHIDVTSLSNTKPKLLNLISETIINSEFEENQPIIINYAGVESDTIYQCFFDNIPDDKVTPISNCSEIAGLDFNNSTGTLTWIPNYTQSGQYEFKIIASKLNTSDENIHVININNSPLLVESLFPNNAQWNDYVKYDDPAIEVYFQNDEACAPVPGLGYNDCIHAGERKKATIRHLNSCAGITISDSLGAFDWICKVVKGDVVAYSRGLNPNFGLKDLIEIDSGLPVWKKNSLIVKLNDSIFQISDTLTWWNNSLLFFPDSNGATITITDDGEDIGRIFVLANNAIGDGYEILDDKTGFVTINDAVFTITSVSNCNDATGMQASPNRECIFLSSGVNHIWIEGIYNTNNETSSKPAMLFNLVFSQLRNFTGLNMSSGGGILISGVSYGNRFISNKFLGDSGSSSGFLGLDVSASHNLLYEQNGSNSTTQGTGIPFSIIGGKNVMIKTKISNTSGNATYGGSIKIGGQESTIVDIHSNSSSANGIFIGAGSSRNTLLHATSVNANIGLAIGNGTYLNLVHNLLSANNNYGIATNGTTTTLTLSNSATVNNKLFGISLNSVNGKLTNQFITGGNGGGSDDCNIVSGSSSPGFIQGTCTDSGTHLSSTYTGQLSDAVLITGRDSTNSFVGKVVSTDLENLTNTNGIQAFSQNNDYFNFENWYRSWGIDGPTYPDVGNIGTCFTGTCRIWDLRLQSSDSNFLNTSNTGVSINDQFVAGLTCPNAIDGNKILTDSQTIPNTFLMHAMEIIFDDIGDDDGLCESNEACIYTPNYGSYQGEGDYKKNGECLFNDGIVSNIKMYTYPQNGF